MGAQQSSDRSLDPILNRLNPDEIRAIDAIYEQISKEKRTTSNRRTILNEDDLLLYVRNKLPLGLSKSLFRVIGCYGDGGGTTTSNFKGFAKTLTYLLKGDDDELADVLINFVFEYDDQEITRVQIMEFLVEISDQLILNINSTHQYRSWKFADCDNDSLRVANLLFHDLLHKDWTSNKSNDTMSRSQLTKWFRRQSLLTTAIGIVFKGAFSISENQTEPLLVPACNGAAKAKTNLDLSSVLLIQNALPPQLRQSWHLLYSAYIHGASFSTMLGLVIKKGPTVIVVKDDQGHLFGGFSSVSWEYKPAFTGNENCFVFALFPEIALYGSTGYNTNYVYLCLHQHTLPNGLGFGGQLNNFGLWIDGDFDHGHSTPGCATYKSPLLAGTNQFKIDSVEVWRAGPEIIEDKPMPQTSCLDSDITATAMLTMVNKIGASDGLREAGVEEK